VPAESVPAPKMGRPRSADVERSILQAAADLLAERGLNGMTIEDVAARAGVGKTSIYRRWETKGALALDAFLVEFLAAQPLPDTGTLAGDLLAALRAWTRTVRRSTTGRSLVSLIAAAQQDPDLAVAWRERVVLPARAQHRHMIDRAVERGELPPGTDTDVMIDLLYGPAYHRLLHGHLPLNDRFLKRVVAIIVAGAEAGAATSTTSASTP
jgi:AcrR family transcriptional regulator